MNFRSLFLTVFCLFIFAEQFAQLSVCSYKFRKRITFNQASVSGTSAHTDFPVIISLASDNDLRVAASGGDVQSVNGYDIIFTAADGYTLLDFERVKYVSTTGQLQCWVKIPSLSPTAKTFIYMYYGNAAATEQSTNNTWSNGYVGVWHFDNSLNNSTSTAGLNATNFGSTNSAIAQLGESRLFVESSSQYAEVAPYNAAYNITSDLTISTWYRPTSVSAGQRIASNENNSTGGYMLGMLNANKLEFEIRTSSNTAVGISSAGNGNPLNGGNWYYINGQYSDASNFLKTYVNGVVERTLSTTASMGSSNATLKLSRDAFAASGYLDGILDELRISNVIRSADWIATEYNNQLNPAPGTFYTISTEPVTWSGASGNNWSTNGNWVGGAKPVAYNDAILTSNGSQPTLNESIQLSSLWVQPSTTLSLSGSNTLSIAYDILNCGFIQLVGPGYLTLNSTSAYAQTQYLSGSGTYFLTNVLVNNTYSSNPSVVLNKDISVIGYLNLNSGILYSSASNYVYMTSGSSCSPGKATSFVSGPVIKNGNTAFVFPVGKGTKWRRLGISATDPSTATSTFRAEYFDSSPDGTIYVTSPLTDVSTTEYWNLDRVNGSGAVRVSLYWENASASNINNCPDLTIARWSGTTWQERPATTVAGSTCSGTGTGTITTTASLTAFSPFTFGSKSASLNPLPVELTKFTTECSGNGVSINWSTATEKNSNHFIVEKSLDGENWAARGKVNSAGNSVTNNDYSFFDTESSSAISYYRLRQVDNDQRFDFSPVVLSSCIALRNEMRMYPNPAKEMINLEFNLSGDYGSGAVQIVDALGRIAVQQELRLEKGLSRLALPLNLSSGAYSVILVSEYVNLLPQKLIVR